jgi:hypothetical protein
MRLKRVLATGVKNFSFALDLDAMNVIIGDNFRGKTARTDAIRLLLLGYLPELGKTAAATFSLCGGREMTIVGEFDDGTTIRRRWYLKGDSVKEDHDVPEAFAAASALLSVMISARSYFALGPTDRLNYILANVPGAGDDTTIEAMTEVAVHELYQTEGLKSEAIAEFVRRFNDARLDAEKAPSFVALTGSEKWTPQSFVEFAIAFSKEEASGAKTRAAIFEKTAQGLSYLRTQDKQPADLPALIAKRERLRGDVAAALDERAKAKATAEQARANAARREKVVAQIAAGASLRDQLSAKRAAVDRLTAEVEKAGAIDPRAIEALITENAEVAAGLSNIGRQIADVNASIERNNSELAGLASKKRCAYCGAAGEGWKTLKTAEIESALAGLKVKLAQLVEQQAKVKEHSAAVATRLADLRTRRGLRDGKERELALQKVALDTAERDLKTIAELEKFLAEIPAQSPDAARAHELAAERFEKLGAELLEVERTINVSDGRVHELRRLAESEKARDENLEAEKVAKAATAEWVAAQERLVADAFGALLRIANSIFAPLLPSPLAYSEGDIGTWRDGVWIGHKTFSGTEQALAYAAIQLAIAARSPARIMIIDELGRLSADLAKRVATQIARALLEGEIDQFVGIDVARAEQYSIGAHDVGVECQIIEIVATV